jgi:hypothetical protein
LLQGEASLSDFPDFKLLLNRLHSVLYIPKEEDLAIKSIHLSFREFLTNEQRCSNSAFRIYEEKVHESLYCGCIVLMSSNKGLKSDLCDLKAPRTRVVERKEATDGSEVVERSQIPQIELGLQYACRFWAGHLQQIKEHKLELFRLALGFLEKHFLHWLEALSLMGKTSEGVIAIGSLESYIQVSSINSRL